MPGLSVVLFCLCFRLFLLTRCSRVIMGIHLLGCGIMSTSNLCDKRHSKSFGVPVCRFVSVFVAKARVPFIQLDPTRDALSI